MRVRETILRVKIFQNFKIFKCSYLWPKRPQSWTKVSGDNFEGQGDHFRGQFFSKISKFSNVLIFGQNVHKSWTKVSGDHFEGQGDHFKGQNLFKISKFSNVLMFGQYVHKVEQKCRETILRIRETILGVRFFSKFQNFQMCLIFTKMYKKLTKSVGRPF